MSEELTRLLDVIGDDLPDIGGIGLGTFYWLHGTNKGGAKAPGAFYVKDTEVADVPASPWQNDARFEDEGEVGFSATELKIAPIVWRSQWYMPSEDRQGPKNWLVGYEDGASKQLDLICLVEGIADPMVLSASGANKSGAFLDILSQYRRGLLHRATLKAKRGVPPWAYWLPIANKRTADGKTIFDPVKDRSGKDTGAVVTPPALYLPADAIDRLVLSEDDFRRGIEAYRQYSEWAKERRLPPQIAEGYVVNAPQLPPGRNTPQPIEVDEL